MEEDILQGQENNTLKGSLELALLNRLFENNGITKETYYKVKESIVKEYGLKIEGLPLKKNGI